MVMLPYEYKNVRICDIDGVLLEIRPISGYFNEPAVAFDTAKEMLNGWFNDGDYILLWTARPEEYRQLTMQQLDENGFKYHKLLMNKPHAKDCIHIYDDANIEVHKIDKYKGLVSVIESVEKQLEKVDNAKNNFYYDEIVEESRKAGKLVLPEEIYNALEDLDTFGCYGIDKEKVDIDE